VSDVELRSLKACLTGQLSIDLDGPSIVVADADASQVGWGP
jgi:hypothetical protein